MLEADGAGDKTNVIVNLRESFAARRPAQLSVAIPCHNEEKVLPEFHRRLTAACRAAVGEDYEIVLVNDGSRTAPGRALQSFTEADPHVLGVDLTRNFGHQAALTCALTICEGERIFILDADLQDPPELLGPMMAAMNDGADVVYGKRVSRAGETHPKKITAKLFYCLLRRLIDFEIPTDAGDFRLMSRRVLDALLNMPETNRYLRGMVSWIGFRQVPIEYDRQSRFAGETGYTFGKMINFALDAITAFSVRPLRLGLYAGVGLFVLSWLGILYSLASLFFGTCVRGWTSLIITVMFLGGAQIFMLGVIGEYVSRTFIQTKGRPLYLVGGLVGAARRSLPSTVQGAEKTGSVSV